MRHSESAVRARLRKRERPHSVDAHRPEGSLVPLVLLALAGFFISVHVAFLAGPLWDADERPHAAYAVSLMLGELPTIDTAVIDDPERFPAISAALKGNDAAHRDIWTANHPPLYYLLSVPALALAEHLGHPGAGLLAMRLLNAASMALSLLLVGLTARELVPRRPAVWYLAGLVALSCATVAHLGGFILNDGLGVAASSATLLMGLRMLRRGVSGPALALAAAAGAVAASVRAPGVLAVVVCAVMVACATYVRAARRRVITALAAAAVVSAVPAAAIGWFYLRNLRLYGDVGATAALLEKFGRQSRGSFIDVASNWRVYRTQIRSLWVRTALDESLRAVVFVLLGAVILGLVVALVVRLRRADRAPLPPSEARTRSWQWGLMLLFCVVIEGLAISFTANGGSPHVRYLFTALPVIATVCAVGLLGLGAWRSTRRTTDQVVVGVAGALLLAFLAVIQADSSRDIAGRPRPDGLAEPSLGGAAPAVAIGLASACAIAALLMAVRALGRQRTPHAEPVRSVPAGA